MTTEQFKHGITKGHGPSIILAIVGTGLIAFGFTNPQESASLITAIVGAMTAAIGAFNSQRVGLTNKIEKVERDIPSNTVDNTVTMLGPVIGEAIVGLRHDLDRKHEENKQQFAKLADDKTAGERRLELLEKGHIELKQSHDELRDSVIRIEQKFDQAIQAKG